MFIHIRTGICFCGELVSTIVLLIYVYYIAKIGSLHVFLECIRCVMYKYRKIHEIWACVLEWRVYWNLN